MAGTSAAAILGPVAGSADIAADPASVSLVRVGDVQGDAYLQKLLDAMLALQGFNLSDERSVNFLRPCLSNARTAWILFEELWRFTEVPKEVDSDKVLQIWKRRSGVQLGLCSISNYSTALELLREKPPADRDYRSTVHFSSSLALAHMLLAAFDVPTIIPEDGDCLELLVAESERRFSEVLTGKKATTVHLPYPFPPSDERKTSGVPQNLIREILKALTSGETVVLLNGPRAQGADVIVLRRACNGKKPLVRLLQIKNRGKPVGSLDVLRTLGAGAGQNRNVVQPVRWSERVLAWLCRLLSEQPVQGSALQDQFQNVSEVAQIPSMDVDVELILLERKNKLSRPLPLVKKPNFLDCCPIFKLLNLTHLVPFPTDMPLTHYVAQGCGCVL
ncbi:unnamed protein product [Symbiodinium sp. KB8]|nr:unnamed protein product [Symbiodinium sp. KB8]